ncbi:LysM peptidoglycan-binding domain-containing protein [Paenibacillus sp. P26]|nr:LysM peptidoglycan-binding domain-containing protein [Paenibacillus sp. P26]
MCSQLQIYVSEHGDTLRKIADRYGLEAEHLLSMNPHLTGADQSLVREYM